MSNRNELMHEEQDGDSLARIKGGAKAMAMARRMRDNLSLEYSGECVLEEAVLCVVLTNAVEVQVNGGPLVGIAVYDPTFSWINHSCSPNACYTFLLPDYSGGQSRLRILGAATGRGCSSNGIEGVQNGGCDNYESTEGSSSFLLNFPIQSCFLDNSGVLTSIRWPQQIPIINLTLFNRLE